MSWLDPDRTVEDATETALREELRGLLGAGPRNVFENEPSPELIVLADDLRREAKRRNRTARKEHSWMLLAAALPFALLLVGVGGWGISQKHKADGYAAVMQQKETEIQRLAAAVQSQVRRAEPSLAVAPAPLQLASHTKPKPKPKTKGKELVIPVERSAEPLGNDTQRVKGH